MGHPAGTPDSAPVAAVQGSVLNGFGDVFDGDVLLGGEVGDGTGDLEDAVVGASAETLLLHGTLEQALGVGGEFAKSPDLLGVHLRVGEDGLRRGAGSGFGPGRVAAGREGEAGMLQRAGGQDAGTDLGRPLGGGASAQLFILHGRDFDVDVDAVEQRARDFRDVALDHGRGTHAVAGFVVEVAAGAGVHGCGEHEARGEAERHGGAGYGDGAVFERLAQDFEDVAGEFRQLV